MMKYLHRAKSTKGKLLRTPLMKPRASYRPAAAVFGEERLPSALPAEEIIKYLINYLGNISEYLAAVYKKLVNGCAVSYIKISAPASIPSCIYSI